MKWTLFSSFVRLKMIVWILGILLCVIILRVAYVQIFQFESLTEKAKINWDREIPFIAQRGLIVDRDENVIVSNQLAPTIYFMPAQNENVENVAKLLAPLLNITEQRLIKKLSEKTYLIKLAPEGKNISQTVAEKISMLNIPGIFVANDYIRTYPYGNLLSRLVGFTGFDYTGLSGLEYAYNDVLTSKSNAIRLYTDAQGNALPHVQTDWLEGSKGANLQLTIDLKLQQIVERELSQAMISHNADQALAVAMDPNNGEILALASFPTYNPENYQDVTPEIYNRNLPVFMTYEPGSTFKIITLAAALEEKVVDLKNEYFYDAGYTNVEGARLRCWKREGHKNQTFMEVVENSCNPGFIEMGQRLGAKKLLTYIKKFGFGASTGSTLSGEAKGILFQESAYGPVEHATTSFGQGVSVTPIQQVQAVAAAVNGGLLYKPSIIRKIYTEKDEIFVQNPELKHRVISEKTSAQIREALEHVVANGSGRQAYKDGLRIGGKTGTAQKVENGKYIEGNYIVSFIGVMPANKPEIVLYVAMDHPKSNLQFGGVIAAPIVGSIFEDYAKAISLPKDSNQLEKKYVWGDELTARIPNLLHEKKETILKQQYPFEIVWHGTGSTIIDQLPKPNERLNQTEILHLFLSD